MLRMSSWISSVLSIALLSQLTACGTLLYPERRGQIEGRIDPAVVGMNAIGVLFFVLPGLVAFAIDFATGAIYMPGGKYSLAPEVLDQAREAQRLGDQITLQRLIFEHTGQKLPLTDPRLVQSTHAPVELAHYGLAARG